jgi:membrane associated rhomboid family serine protease
MLILAQMLRSLFDMAMSLMGLLGFKGSRWEWKKTQWKMSLESRIASWEMTERGIRAKVRMCPSCRELVDRSLSVCPACGGSMRGVEGGGAGRLMAAILPQFSSLTAVLITVNVVFFLLPLVLGGQSSKATGILSVFSPPIDIQFAFGAKQVDAILLLHQYWRLVTAGFLHGGIIHLAFNMYALSILGPMVEEAFGWRKFLFIYTLTDIVAFGTSTLASSSRIPSLGASGALFGLLGFGVAFGRFRGGARGRAVSDHLVRMMLPAVIMLFLPGIDNLAHVGGFISGGLLGLVISPGDPATPSSRGRWNLLTALTLLVLFGSFLVMLVGYSANLRLWAPR